jgi:methionine--tRNA ligase beta chain
MESDIKSESENISFDDFSKIVLKLGKIKKIEYLPKLNKVYKAEIDLGSEERIVVVVGGAVYYKPEELEEKLVIVCTNLSPRTIGNIESKGMILALDGMEGKPIFLTIDKGEKVELGSKVR